MMMRTPFLMDHTRSMIYSKQKLGGGGDYLTVRKGSDANIYNDPGSVSNFEGMNQPANSKTGNHVAFQSEVKPRIGSASNQLINKNNK